MPSCVPKSQNRKTPRRKITGEVVREVESGLGLCALGQSRPDLLNDFLIGQIVMQALETRVAVQVEHAVSPPVKRRLQVTQRFFLLAQRGVGGRQIVGGSR